MEESGKQLLIGIGNPDRRDDGLGWEFLSKVRDHGITNWQLIEKSNLSEEDSELIRNAITVIFVDSNNSRLERGYRFEECHAQIGAEYTSHPLNPCSLLALAYKRYKAKPTTFVLRIQGFEWGMGKGLSPRASKNLDKAVHYFDRKFGKLNVPD